MVASTDSRDRSGADRIAVGVLSDTHGLLDPRAVRALQGVDHIVHAGDVCGEWLLSDLARIAPVTAVRGNCDHHGKARGLGRRAVVVIGGVRFIVAHKAGDAVAGLDAAILDGAVVVTGHTHQSLIERRGPTLWVNPGSASDPRSGCAASVAIVEVDGGVPEARIVAL